jgi:hypothetical protein
MDQRGQFGDVTPPFSEEADPPMRRREVVAPQEPAQQGWGQPGQVDPGYGPAPAGYGPPQGWPVPPPLKKKTSKLGIGCLAAVGLLLVIVITAVAAGGGKNSPTAAATTPPAAVPAVTGAAAGPTSAAVVAPVSTTPAAPPPAQTVTYSCTGHAADGVDITYGPEGSSYSASHLPFTATQPLNANAQYFVTEAQLQGDGTVSCNTVVNYVDGSGDAQSVTNSATASGGYNIGSAEICSDFSGDWQDC